MVWLAVTVQEAIRTLRSMRRLKSDPVEPEKIQAILTAAGMAPSGGNSQPWEFILITDVAVKGQLRELVVQGLETYARSNLRIPKDTVPEFLSSTNPVAWLAQNTDKIPVLILACLNTRRAKRLTDDWAWLEEQSNWASIFPAVQNLLLAASLGSRNSHFNLPTISNCRTEAGPSTSRLRQTCYTHLRGLPSVALQRTQTASNRKFHP